jgi:hypothetical protein
MMEVGVESVKNVYNELWLADIESGAFQIVERSSE